MIVIVIGMHRSGTSALSGVLHQHGIIMGSERSFRPKPAPENPRGYYEHYGFRCLNDALLLMRRYRTKSYRADVPVTTGTSFLKPLMRHLVRTQTSEHWGWKDPRTCLTLDAWVNLLKEDNLLDQTRFVFASREPHTVARSLSKRESVDYSQALRLWEAYNRTALKHIDATTIPTAYVSYETICQNPIDELSAVLRFLDTPPSTNIINDFFDTSLNRSSRDAPERPDLPNDLNKQIEQLNQQIHQRIDSFKKTVKP